MLNDILDLSKIEAGKMDVDAVPFPLPETVVEAARLLAVSISQKKLDLVCHIDPAVPDMVVGDPNRLRQILVNLVGNALKFTERGRIEIDVSVSQRTETHASVHFVVRDSGIGIPADKQARIFEAFDQGEMSVTRRFGGTGLGLSISSQLVSLMNGRIWVESEPGRGSEFHFALPFACDTATPNAAQGIDAAATEQNGTEDESPRGACLVLARDERTLAAYQSIARQCGWEAVGSRSPEEALMLLVQIVGEGKPVDRVVVDLLIHCQEEVRLIGELLRTGVLRADQVVALVPAGAESACRHLDRMGVRRLLEKPVLGSDLRRALSRRETTVDSARSHQAGLGEGGALRPLRVLVVDDSPVNCEVASGLLELLGHQAVTVDNGRAALDACETRRFDIVFMDIEMPEMDGLTASRLLRDRERVSSAAPIPIYAMTAHALDGCREECEAAGMNGLIHKPVQPDELKRILDGIAEQGPVEPIIV